MKFRISISPNKSLSWAQWFLIVAICTIAAGLAQRYLSIAINDSGSIKARALLMIRGTSPKKLGEYVVFRWNGSEAMHRRGAQFVKIVAGLPGDIIAVDQNRIVTVSGRVIGYAQPFSTKKLALDVIDPGPIPPGYIFVVGDSKNSFDSRYKLVGLIKNDLILGTAYAIF